MSAVQNKIKSTKDMLFVGDPVKASAPSGVFIANIKLFEFVNKKLTSVLLNSLSDEKLVARVLKLNLNETDELLYWDGTC